MDVPRGVRHSGCAHPSHEQVPHLRHEFVLIVHPRGLLIALSFTIPPCALVSIFV